MANSSVRALSLVLVPCVVAAFAACDELEPITLPGASAAGASGSASAGRGSAGMAGSANGAGGATTGGSSGTTGRGGSGGTAGASASAGSSASGAAGGTGGTLGAAGTDGDAGAGAIDGAGGSGGSAGTKTTGGASGGAGKSATGGAAGKGGSGGAGGGAGKGGSSGAGGSGGAGSGGKGGSAGNSGTGGGAGSSSTGWDAGNPDGSCGAGIPSRGQPVSTSSPTAVVGTGTAGSCTFSALKTAVTAGGTITFNCGADPLTIAVTQTLNLPTNKNTVLDGGQKITLDGGHAVEILRFDSPDFRANDHGLTVQHIAFANAKATPTEAIPYAPAPCSQGWNDGEGGAIYIRDGYLTVIDAIFTGNQAAPEGPDTGGGAIYALGSKAGVTIVGSTFKNNQASNAGAVGGLFSELDIYDSVFSNNQAIGHDANSNDPDSCDAMNNGQNEIGSGGNGGAIYSDGNSVNIVLCGDAILTNAAGSGAFGGGIFFTSNDFGGTLSIADTKISGNTGGHWTQVDSGSVTNAGTAVGTNAKSISISNSMIQGVN